MRPGQGGRGAPRTPSPRLDGGDLPASVLEHGGGARGQAAPSLLHLSPLFLFLLTFYLSRIDFKDTDSL